MPSPFPGMDPYLEQHWDDFHTSLCVYARNQLQEMLPSDFVARVEERSVVTDSKEAFTIIRPDLHVREEQREKSSSKASSASVAEPIVYEFWEEPEIQRSIEIRRKGSPGQVITTIELLSPTNKREGSKSFREYRRKQAKSLKAKINLVEIDLIREGGWAVSLPGDCVPNEHLTPYKVVVRRGGEVGRAEFYPITLRQKLPTIAVPLRKTDPDAPLDLQPLIEQCYKDGRYDGIDYNAEPEPPLSSADAQWADQLLRKAGLRGKKKRK